MSKLYTLIFASAVLLVVLTTAHKLPPRAVAERDAIHQRSNGAYSVRSTGWRAAVTGAPLTHRTATLGAIGTSYKLAAAHARAMTKRDTIRHVRSKGAAGAIQKAQSVAVTGMRQELEDAGLRRGNSNSNDKWSERTHQRRALFQTIDDERDHYDIVDNSTDAGFEFVRKDQCTQSGDSCDINMHCWGRDQENDGWCKAETVGCRDCASSENDVCYNARECVDPLFHCDSLSSAERHLITLEARTLHFEELGVKHPCIAQECAYNRESAACAEIVWNYCCDPMDDACPLTAPTACTALGCSDYMQQWHDYFDPDKGYTCPFEHDTRLCTEGACEHWAGQVYDAFVTGNRCYDDRPEHCLLDTVDSFCLDPDRDYPMSDDREAVLEYEAHVLNWTTTYSTSETTVIGVAPDGTDALCVQSANKCPPRACEFMEWAWPQLLDGQEIQLSEFDWSAEDLNNTEGLAACAWHIEDEHLVTECFKERLAPCFPDPDLAPFLDVPLEVNHYACGRDIAKHCATHPDDPGCSPPCPFKCADLGAACPCAALQCTALMELPECTRAACQPFHRALIAAYLDRGGLQPTDEWMRNSLRHHIVMDKTTAPSPFDELQWTSEMVATGITCPATAAYTSCFPKMMDFCNKPVGWWQSGCRTLLSQCGDGRLSWGEQCEDGNHEWWDGCHGCHYINPGHVCPVEGAPCFECWQDDRLENSWDPSVTNVCPFCINNIVDTIASPANHSACIAMETAEDAAACQAHVAPYCAATNASGVYDPGCSEWVNPEEAFAIPRVADNATFFTFEIPFNGQNIMSKRYAVIRARFESRNGLWNDTTPRVEWMPPLASNGHDLSANVTALLQRVEAARGLSTGDLYPLTDLELSDVSPYWHPEIESSHGDPIWWEGTQPLAHLTHVALLNNYHESVQALSELQNDPNRGCDVMYTSPQDDGPMHGGGGGYAPRGEPLQTIPPCKDPVDMVAHSELLDITWHREHGQWDWNDDFSALDPYADSAAPTCERDSATFVGYIHLSTTYRESHDGRTREEPRWLPAIPRPTTANGGPDNATLNDALESAILEAIGWDVANDPAGMASKAYDATGINVKDGWLPPTTIEAALEAGLLRLQFERKLWAAGCTDRECDALMEHCRVVGLEREVPKPSASAFEKASVAIDALFAEPAATTWGGAVKRTVDIGRVMQSRAIADVFALYDSITENDLAPQYLRAVENHCPHYPWHHNGSFNVAWSADPCCNHEKRRIECCPPRDIPNGFIKNVVGVDEEAVRSSCAHPTEVVYALQDTLRRLEDADACIAELEATTTHDSWAQLHKFQETCHARISNNGPVIDTQEQCTSDDDCYCDASKCTDYNGRRQCVLDDKDQAACTAQCMYDEMDPRVRRHVLVLWGMLPTATLGDWTAAFLDQVTEMSCVGPTGWRPYTEWRCDAECEAAHVCDSWQHSEQVRREQYIAEHGTTQHQHMPWVDFNANAEVCTSVGGVYSCQNWQRDAYGQQTDMCEWWQCTWPDVDLPCENQHKCWESCHAPCSQAVACMKTGGTWFTRDADAPLGGIFRVNTSADAAAIEASVAAGTFVDPFLDPATGMGGYGECCPQGGHIRVNTHRMGTDDSFTIWRENECTSVPAYRDRGHHCRTSTCCSARGGKWRMSMHGGECCMGVFREEYDARSRQTHTWCDTHLFMECGGSECTSDCHASENACTTCHDDRRECCGEVLVPVDAEACSAEAHCNDARVLQNHQDSNGHWLSPWSPSADQAAVCTSTDTGFCVEKSRDWSWPYSEEPRCSIDIYEHELEWWQTQSMACEMHGGTWRENEWPQCIRLGVTDIEECFVSPPEANGTFICPDRFAGLWLPEGFPQPANPWHHVWCSRGCYAPDVSKAVCDQGRGNWHNLDWVSPSNGNACDWGTDHSTGECPGMRLKGCFREWTFEEECIESAGNGAWVTIPGHPDHGLCLYTSINSTSCAVLLDHKWVDGCFDWFTDSWHCERGWAGEWVDARVALGVGQEGTEVQPACRLHEVSNPDHCDALRGYAVWGCFATPGTITPANCTAAGGVWWTPDPTAPGLLRNGSATCNWPDMTSSQCFDSESPVAAYSPYSRWDCWEWAITNQTVCTTPDPGVMTDIQSITAPFGGACNLWESDEQRCVARGGDLWRGCYQWDMNQTTCIAEGHTWQESSTNDNDWASCKLNIASDQDCWQQPGHTLYMSACYAWTVGNEASCTNAPNGWWNEEYANGTGICQLHRWDAETCRSAPVPSVWVDTQRGFQNGRFNTQQECDEGQCQGSVMWRAWHGWSNEQCEALSDWECDRSCPRCLTWQRPFHDTGFGGCFTNATIGSCPDWGCCDPPCVITRFPDTGEVPTEATCRSADHTDIEGMLHWVTCDDMPGGSDACPNPDWWGPDDELGRPPVGDTRATEWPYQATLQCRRGWHRCQTREACEAAGWCNDHENTHEECTDSSWPHGRTTLSVTTRQIAQTSTGQNYTTLRTEHCPYDQRVQLDGVCVKEPSAATGWACSPGTMHRFGCRVAASNYSECIGITGKWYARAQNATQCRALTGCTEPFRSDILPKTPEECARCRGTVVQANIWYGGTWKAPGIRDLHWTEGRSMVATNTMAPTYSTRLFEPIVRQATMAVYIENRQAIDNMQFRARVDALRFIAADCGEDGGDRESTDFKELATRPVPISSMRIFCGIDTMTESACQVFYVAKACEDSSSSSSSSSSSASGNSSRILLTSPTRRQATTTAGSDDYADLDLFKVSAGGFGRALEPCTRTAGIDSIAYNTGVNDTAAVGQLVGDGIIVNATLGSFDISRTCLSRRDGLRWWPAFTVPAILRYNRESSTTPWSVFNVSGWADGVEYCFAFTEPGTYFPARVAANASLNDACAPSCVAGHGICLAPGATCTCYCGFDGPGCAHGCLNNCTSSSAGACNGETNTCTCNSPHIGNDCSHVNCSTTRSDGILCSGHGTCASSGICACALGWSGTACSERLFQIRPEATAAGFNDAVVTREMGILRLEINSGLPLWAIILIAVVGTTMLAVLIPLCCTCMSLTYKNSPCLRRTLCVPLSPLFDDKGLCARRCCGCCSSILSGRAGLALWNAVCCCGLCRYCCCSKRKGYTVVTSSDDGTAPVYGIVHAMSVYSTRRQKVLDMEGVE